MFRVCLTVEKDEQIDETTDRYEWNMPKHVSRNEHIHTTPQVPLPIRTACVRRKKDVMNQHEQNADAPKKRTHHHISHGECCRELTYVLFRTP